MQVSQRLKQVPVSPVRKLIPYALEAKKQGVKIYHLNIGDPDIKTPEVMLEVLRHWSRNPISYEHSQGNLELLEALKTYYHNLGFTYLKKKHLQVTLGGSEAISMAMFSVTNPGEEILVFEPFYANYKSYATYSEIRLVPIPTNIRDGFHLPPVSQIEKKISKKTRAILICNPNNPTGTVYTRQELEGLVKLVKKHQLFLFSDEVYREFVYDGKKHVSLFSFMEQLPEQAIVLDSLSKRYSLCGARIGVLASLNEEIMAGVLRLAQGRLSAGLVDQMLAAKLSQVPVKYLAGVKREYAKRRDLLYAGLQKIPGVSLHKPEGAFYTVVSLPVKDAEDFCIWLLTSFRDKGETVMLAPAAGFYATPGLGKHEVRMAYVLNTRDLTRCLELLKKALIQYQHGI